MHPAQFSHQQALLHKPTTPPCQPDAENRTEMGFIQTNLSRRERHRFYQFWIHSTLFPTRKPGWCLPAPKRNVCRLHVPIKDLVPADHQQSILSSLSAKFHLDTSLFTAFQPQAFNNRKQKGGVRFPVRLLTRSFWPSIVKHQQEAICITIKALKIITEQFLLNSSYQSFWCRNSSDRHWPLKKLFSGQKPSPSNKGKAWDVPSRENMAGERNWTNSQII